MSYIHNPRVVAQNIGSAMMYDSKSTVKEVMEDDQARAIVEKHLPGASNHPLLTQAWYMTMREVSMYPESGMTADKYRAILDDFADITE